MKVRVLSWALVLLLHGLLITWLARTFPGSAKPPQALPILAVDIVALERQAELQTAMQAPSVSPPPAPDTSNASEKATESPKKKARAAKGLPHPVRPHPEEGPVKSATSPSLPVANVSPPSAPASAPAPSATPATSHATASTSAQPTTTPVYIPADYAVGNRPPVYPSLSRRYQEEGTVVLRVLVRADGKAGQIEIGTSSGYSLLDQAARQAVQNWRFAPATNNGQAVSDWFLLPIRFTLHE